MRELLFGEGGLHNTGSVFEMETDRWCLGKSSTASSHSFPNCPIDSLVARAGFYILIDDFLEDEMFFCLPNCQDIACVAVSELFLLKGIL
jgi:hypothetical protein